MRYFDLQIVQSRPRLQTASCSASHENGASWTRSHTRVLQQPSIGLHRPLPLPWDDVILLSCWGRKCFPLLAGRESHILYPGKDLQITIPCTPLIVFLCFQLTLFRHQDWNCRFTPSWSSFRQGWVDPPPPFYLETADIGTAGRGNRPVSCYVSEGVQVKG